jgi:3-oxoacyl-[acyl-carrier-protein] synthase II
MTKQAVITGLGIISPIGIGIERFWHSACGGRSGLGRPTLFTPSRVPLDSQIVGEVKDFSPDKWLEKSAYKTAGRFSQFAVAAAKLALEDAQLNTKSLIPTRTVIGIGNSMNGLIDVHERNYLAFLDGRHMQPTTVLEYPAHAATSHVAIAIGAQSNTATIATACVAGIDSIAWGVEQIARGEASFAIVGGTEAPLSDAAFQAFYALGALATWSGPPAQASRPFDALRSGLVLAEGAAIVVLEEESSARARGAFIYARVLGSATISESAHLRDVDPEGATAARSMELAVRRAGLRAADVDYICAHGNGLVDYDASETAAIKRTFGRHARCIPVSSIKSMCGQALAASGAIQVVTTCLAIRDNIVPPTANYDVPDPSCDLDYVPNQARVVRVRHALIHAQSIGGTHAALVLGAAH